MATIPTFLASRGDNDLPSNVEAEAAFLGAVLIDNSTLEVAPELCPQHFFVPLHGRLFERIEALRERNQVVTPITLKPYFEADEGPQGEGAIPYIARLTNVPHGLLAAEALAGQIIELAERRKLIALGQELIDAASDTSTMHYGKLLADAADRIAGLERQSGSDQYPVLLPAELKALPEPVALVEGLLFADTFAALYAEPKAFKSFAALDLGLHLAHGRTWCGLQVEHVGVLYIAGEGVQGLRRRVPGWHVYHGIDEKLARFTVLPLAVELLDPRNRQRLAQAVKCAADKCGDEIGLIVIDTLSRAIPGADENSTQQMTLVVQACDDIRRRTGCAILAVHHAGKEKGRGLRGSSVTLGALDTVIRADRNGDSLTLTVEAQKDAAEAPPFHFEMVPVEWKDADGSERKTLVPVPSATREVAVDSITRAQIDQAFALLEERWLDGQPLSQSPNTKRDGRYAAKILASKFGGSVDQWRELITSWLESRCLEIGMANSTTKLKGLRVLRRPFDER